MGRIVVFSDVIVDFAFLVLTLFEFVQSLFDVGNIALLENVVDLLLEAVLGVIFLRHDNHALPLDDWVHLHFQHILNDARTLLLAEQERIEVLGQRTLEDQHLALLLHGGRHSLPNHFLGQDQRLLVDGHFCFYRFLQAVEIVGTRED